jgi:hypothetical protein
MLGYESAERIMKTQIDYSSRYSMHTNHLRLARGTLMLGLAVLGLLPLVATAQPVCVSPPPGLVAWWPGEGTANDYLNVANGTLNGGVSFVAGEVGQAFNFDGSSGYVNIPASAVFNVAAGGALTVECWIKPAALAGAQALAEWNTGGQLGLHFWISQPTPFGGGDGSLYANLVDTAGTFHTLTSPGGVLNTNDFQHVALTYDKGSGAACLYYNGGLVATQSLGGFTPKTNLGLYLGARPGDGSTMFRGLMDEVSLYNRALSAAELQAIYQAGGAGKCAVAIPPFIVTQPTNQTVTAGTNATFSVTAGGTAPLSFQWRLNDSEITWATNSSMTLTNVQISQAGSYSVVVTNAGGPVTSSNALLTVNLPPVRVRVSNTNAAAGGVVAVPVVVVANGNENALGFSLSFDTAKLTYTGAGLGAGAAGADLIPNTSLINSGKLGLAIIMPTGKTLSSGTQQVVWVNYAVAVLTNATTATNSFGDQPMPRQLWDVQLNPLTATYSNGTVSITAATAFEGDVLPRPNGDKVTTLSDWLQMGRYAARLDYPTNTGEFQRADCAPRSTRGDGAITVADWVQVGRYAFGPDPLTAIGGPTAETSGSGAGPSANRVVTAGQATMLQGQTGTLSVTLAAQGNENALGFSLDFDPTLVSFAGAGLGSDAAGAMLFINGNQAASGRLGFALSLGTGGSFPAGIREVIWVSFRASSSVSGTFSPLFTDQPVPLEVSDAGANALPASYANGAVIISPIPSLRIALSDQDVLLAWPLWATNFLLQEADGSLAAPPAWTNLSVTVGVSNDESVVTLPVSGAGKFYRLYHP